MKKLLLLLLLTAFFMFAKAQKHYITNQYLYELYMMNPAAAGFNKDCYLFSFYNQKKWLKMDDSPTTQILSYQGPINKSIGLGTYFYNDKNGFYSEIGFQTSFSYKVILIKKRRQTVSMTFGMSVNVEQSSIEQTELRNDAILDPAISGSNDKGSGFNSNAGILFKYNKYHIGFSSTNILPQNNPMYLQEDEPALTSDIYIYGGTNFKIPDRDIFLEPLIVYRKNMSVSSKLDLSLKGNFPTPNPNFSMWGLVGYRHTMDHHLGKSLEILMVTGIHINNYIIGIEYQLGLTGAQFNYGSAYQLVCKYRICKDRSKKALPCFEKNKNKRNKAFNQMIR